MMSKEYYEMKTESGLTTIRLRDISAVTTEGFGGVLSKSKVKVAIHLVSGTIFTGTMTTDEKDSFMKAWKEAWKYAL